MDIASDKLEELLKRWFIHGYEGKRVTKNFLIEAQNNAKTMFKQELVIERKWLFCVVWWERLKKLIR